MQRDGGGLGGVRKSYTGGTPLMEKLPLAVQPDWPLEIHVPVMFPLLVCVPLSVKVLFVGVGNSVVTDMVKCPPLMLAVSLTPEPAKQAAIVPADPEPKLDTFTVLPDCFKSAKKVRAVELSGFCNCAFQPPVTVRLDPHETRVMSAAASTKHIRLFTQKTPGERVQPTI